MKAILGRKMGMTSVFAEDGTLYPVTVVEVLPNVVTQVKTLEKDGYVAVQVGYEEKKESRANKAEKGIAKKAMERINERMGREIIVGAHSPSFGFEKNEEECEQLTRIVNESGANVVLVGVGAPKQEKWIMRWKDRMPGVDIWMALGATIDFEAGTLKRAPTFYRKIGMEWLYRFFKEPKRLFKRYFVDDMKFFWYYIKQLFKCYHNPFEEKKAE